MRLHDILQRCRLSRGRIHTPTDFPPPRRCAHAKLSPRNFPCRRGLLRRPRRNPRAHDSCGVPPSWLRCSAVRNRLLHSSPHDFSFPRRPVDNATPRGRGPRRSASHYGRRFTPKGAPTFAGGKRGRELRKVMDNPGAGCTGRNESRSSRQVSRIHFACEFATFVARFCRGRRTSLDQPPLPLHRRCHACPSTPSHSRSTTFVPACSKSWYNNDPQLVMCRFPSPRTNA